LPSSQSKEIETMTMPSVQVVEIGRFELRAMPVIPPGETDVLIRVAVAGLCRTDLKIVRVGHRDLVLPRVPGEEVVGTVEAVGGAVAHLTPGDRVYVYPGVWCGRCAACRAGAENLCRGMQIMGFHRDGGFGPHVTVPAQSVIPLPEALAFDEAVLAEPLSCVLNALELGGLRAGERIGIWGAGPAGTLLARAARAMGSAPVNIEPDRRRREAIDGLEAPGENLFDVAVVAVGDKTAYREALAHLAPRGRLVVFSGLPPADDRPAVSFNQLHYLEQTLVGAYGCCYRHGRAALGMIADGRVSVADMVSHRLPLAALDKALKLVETRAGMKILLDPWQEDRPS
jgi:L-iditol 2-dehydrogenase